MLNFLATKFWSNMIFFLLGAGLSVAGVNKFFPCGDTIQNQTNITPQANIEPIHVDVPDGGAMLKMQRNTEKLTLEAEKSKKLIEELRKENKRVKIREIKVPTQCKPIVKLVRAACDSINNERVQSINKAISEYNKGH